MIFNNLICINYLGQGFCLDSNCKFQHFIDFDWMNRAARNSFTAPNLGLIEEIKETSTASSMSIISEPNSYSFEEDLATKSVKSIAVPPSPFVLASTSAPTRGTAAVRGSGRGRSGITMPPNERKSDPSVTIIKGSRGSYNGGAPRGAYRGGY